MGEDYKQQKNNQPEDKSFELLTRSFILYHHGQSRKVLNIYGKWDDEDEVFPRNEKPYGQTAIRDMDGYPEEYHLREAQRLYFSDIFKVGKDFAYDLVLDFDGLKGNDEFPPTIQIGDEVILLEKVGNKLYRAVIPNALVHQAVKSQKPGYLRTLNKDFFNSNAHCFVSFKSKDSFIPDITSFLIFNFAYKKVIDPTLHPIGKVIPEMTEELTKSGEMILDSNGQALLRKSNYYLHAFQRYDVFGDNPEVTDPPFTRGMNNFVGHRSWYPEEQNKYNDILIKFFNINLADPQPDDHYRNVSLDAYDCSIIQQCDWEGTPYFRLVDPQSLSKVIVRDTKNREEVFLKISPKDTFIMTPMEDSEVMGIKIRRFTSSGSPIDSISAFADTSSVRVSIEPQKRFPAHWEDNKSEILKEIKIDKKNNTFTKVNRDNNESWTYYLDQDVIVHKQTEATVGKKIPDCNSLVMVTQDYMLEATSTYYQTIVEYKPHPKKEYKHIREIKDGVKVDVWDCVRDVVKNRIGWLNADYFVVIQYTTAEDIRSYLQSGEPFQQNTLWIKDEDGKLKYLETGIMHKVTCAQMWGEGQIDDLALYNKRLQVDIKYGSDVFVVGAVKQGVVEYHKIIVTGQHIAGWGRPYNY